MAIPRPPLHLVVAALGVVFLIEFTVLAISPLDRDAWLLENVLVFAGIAFFGFLCLHEIGAREVARPLAVPAIPCPSSLDLRVLDAHLRRRRARNERRSECRASSCG